MAGGYNPLCLGYIALSLFQAMPLLNSYRGYSITPSTDSNAHVTHSNALARSSAAILSGKTRVAGVSGKL